MPSPFPGMDPFIEPHRWEGFHTHFLVEFARTLVPRVRPRYVVETEERLYVEQSGESVGTVRVDLGIDQTRRWPPSEDIGLTSETAAPFLTPVVCLLPFDEELRETFLTVRDAATREIVTVIEMLSATNKRPGSDGRAQYLRKRKSVLQSRVHLVELDLLRGGQRLPMRTPLPPAWAAPGTQPHASRKRRARTRPPAARLRPLAARADRRYNAPSANPAQSWIRFGDEPADQPAA